ncbi:DHA2 family efflux MFS transporter permease subunit [Nonomuraea sp. NPDC047529]|uniref:DHA2 family efflux MFS transporter permease subunit n=1 Tax=Nonomuraea sp. NPDC047529 TaxID=3155623 RepID=UPI00341055BD
MTECPSKAVVSEPVAGAAAEEDEAARLRYAWRAVSVTSLGMFLTGLNSSSLNVALPAVVAHFHADAFLASWVLLAYMLVSSVGLVVFGRVADLFGRRGTYLLGFMVFTAASLAAGFSPSIELLLAARVAQACGSAMILANSSAILAGAFPPARLGRGMAVYMAIISVAGLVGPSFGGFLAGAAGWRWVFWFNVPVGVAAIVWGAVTLRPVPRGPRERLDLPGIVLLFTWLSGLLLALSQGSSLGWLSPWVVAGGVAFAAAAPVFALVEWRSRTPLLDLRLFGDRGFALANLAAVLNSLGQFSIVLVISLFLQSTRQFEPAQAGLAVLPVSAASALTSLVAGALTGRFHPRTVAVAGSALSAAGMAVMLAALDPSVPYAWLGTALGLVGAGSGLFITANTTAIMMDAPQNRLGVVNGVRLMLVNVSTVISTAMSLAIVAASVPAAERHLVYAADPSRLSGVADVLQDGYRLAVTVLLVLAVAATVVTAVSRTGVRRAA